MKSNPIRTYLHLPRATRKLVWEAFRELLFVELMVRVRQFKRYAPSLGRQNGATTLEGGNAIQVQVAREIRWAIGAVSRRLPWKCRCLVQAIAGKRMLQRRGITSTLYLGVDHGEEKWLDAHAWLRCGEVIVTGGAGAERFRIISTFTEDSL